MLRKFSSCSHSVVHDFLLLFCCYCSTLQHCFPLNVRKLYKWWRCASHLPSSTLHPAYTITYTTSLDTWREGHTSGGHDRTSGDHDHTSGDHDHGRFRDANARPTLIGDPPADPSRGPSDDSSRAPSSPVVHTAAVAHRDSL